MPRNSYQLNKIAHGYPDDMGAPYYVQLWNHTNELGLGNKKFATPPTNKGMEEAMQKGVPLLRYLAKHFAANMLDNWYPFVKMVQDGARTYYSLPQDMQTTPAGTPANIFYPKQPGVNNPYPDITTPMERAIHKLDESINKDNKQYNIPKETSAFLTLATALPANLLDPVCLATYGFGGPIAGALGQYSHKAKALRRLYRMRLLKNRPAARRALQWFNNATRVAGEAVTPAKALIGNPAGREVAAEVGEQVFLPGYSTGLVFRKNYADKVLAYNEYMRKRNGVPAMTPEERESIWEKGWNQASTNLLVNLLFNPRKYYAPQQTTPQIQIQNPPHEELQNYIVNFDFLPKPKQQTTPVQPSGNAEQPAIPAQPPNQSGSSDTPWNWRRVTSQRPGPFIRRPSASESRR